MITGQSLIQTIIYLIVWPNDPAQYFQDPIEITQWIGSISPTHYIKYYGPTSMIQAHSIVCSVMELNQLFV